MREREGAATLKPPPRPPPIPQCERAACQAASARRLWGHTMEAFVPCHLAIRRALIMAAWGTSGSPLKAGESLKSWGFGVEGAEPG